MGDINQGRMHSRGKIITLDHLPAWRAALRSQGKVLVVTNGCFDILHIGHVQNLEAARDMGDVLLVGVNEDQTVRQLKGADRPINLLEHRMGMLAALACVDAVCSFPDLRATRFLTLVQPDIYVKGAHGFCEEEKAIVEGAGGKTALIPVVSGISTSLLAEKIRRL
jgi:rfaE bifunctional protein nucleotidyltransferase chain/domain